VSMEEWRSVKDMDGACFSHDSCHANCKALEHISI